MIFNADKWFSNAFNVLTECDSHIIVVDLCENSLKKKGKTVKWIYTEQAS